MRDLGHPTPVKHPDIDEDGGESRKARLAGARNQVPAGSLTPFSIEDGTNFRGHPHRWARPVATPAVWAAMPAAGGIHQSLMWRFLAK